MLFKVKKIIHFLLILLIIPKRNILKLLSHFTKSTSQLNQDLFVLGILDLKKNGFFVEFGACDGKYLSNTFILEKFFNWSGILSEPCSHWHYDLGRNRSTKINHNCVCDYSGKEVIFHENPNDHALSGIMQDSSLTSSYPVASISLMDLLESNNAPLEIDFISIDTEGTEFEILKTFDFKKYSVKIWSVEHNYNHANRNAIIDLFTQNGYRKTPSFYTRFDDWFIKEIIAR